MKFDLTKYEMKKNKILDAAFKCVYQYGIMNVSMRNIAKEAHVNQALLHYYFTNKDNLLLEVLKAMFKRFIFDITKELKDSSKSDNVINDLLDLAEHYDSQHNEMFVVFVEFWSMSIRNEGMKRVFIDEHNKIAELIESVLKFALKTNNIKKISPKILSRQILAFIEGIGLQYYLGDKELNVKEQFTVYKSQLTRFMNENNE